MREAFKKLIKTKQKKPNTGVFVCVKCTYEKWAELKKYHTCERSFYRWRFLRFLFGIL